MFTNTKFATWSLKPEILSGLEKINWDSATEIQRDTIPIALKGLDVIGQARTGSGKTGAFGIPILNAIEAERLPSSSNFVSNKRISKAGFRGIREHIRGHESQYHFCLRWY